MQNIWAYGCFCVPGSAPVACRFRQEPFFLLSSRVDTAVHQHRLVWLIKVWVLLRRLRFTRLRRMDSGNEFQNVKTSLMKFFPISSRRWIDNILLSEDINRNWSCCFTRDDLIYLLLLYHKDRWALKDNSHWNTWCHWGGKNRSSKHYGNDDEFLPRNYLTSPSLFLSQLLLPLHTRALHTACPSVKKKRSKWH